jgi:hypothetical protein
VSETVSKARVWLLALVATALVVDGSVPVADPPGRRHLPALDVPAGGRPSG